MDPNTAISKIMTKKVVVGNLDKHRFTQVRELFLKHNIHHLPVIENGGKLIGIISSHDVLKAYHKISLKTKVLDDKVLDHHIKLKDIMTENPKTVQTTDTISNAVKIFSEKKFHALPVVNGENMLSGIITTNDLIKLF